MQGECEERFEQPPMCLSASYSIYLAIGFNSARISQPGTGDGKSGLFVIVVGPLLLVSPSQFGVRRLHLSRLAQSLCLVSEMRLEFNPYRRRVHL